MTTHRSAALVVAWPATPEARAALESYLAEPGAGPDPAPPALAGAELDFRGADLPGIDLTAAYLLGAELAHVNLAGADLFAATLSGADLTGTDLSGANLGKAEAIGGQARAAVLNGADLYRADLTRADLRSAAMERAGLSAAFLLQADLRGADLRLCSFGPAASPTFLQEARMHGARLEGANGFVTGPVDVGDSAPRLLDGPELAEWFRTRGAPDVTPT